MAFPEYRRLTRTTFRKPHHRAALARLGSACPSPRRPGKKAPMARQGRVGRKTCPAHFVPRGLTRKFRTRGRLCTRRRKSVRDECFSYMTKFVYMTGGVYRLNPGADTVKCRTWRGHSGQVAWDDRRPRGVVAGGGPGRSNAGPAQDRPGDGPVPQGPPGQRPSQPAQSSGIARTLCSGGDEAGFVGGHDGLGAVP